MRFIFEWVIQHQKTVLLAFLMALTVCLPLSMTVQVNYNLMTYLPDDSPAMEGLERMRAAYHQDVPSIQVMKKFASPKQAANFADQLKTVSGVTEVLWLGDVANIHEPLSFQPEALLSDYYQDQNYLYTLTIDSQNQKAVVHHVRDLAGSDAKLAGTAVTTVFSMETTDKEVQSIMLIVLLIVFLILLLTTSSWFEPVLFLVTIGVAIVLNMGTNHLFGEISFVTKAAASLLQLAVSMDYAIFLLHRFSDYRHEGFTVHEAMLNAMEKSFLPILASASTTVFGFAALLLMRFEIGPDMGLVLGKSVLFSLLSVMILLPVLTIRFSKLIDYTHHKPFAFKFIGLNFIVCYLKVPVIILFLALTGVSFLAQSNNEFLYGASKIYADPNLQLNQDRAAIESHFGKTNQLVVLLPSGSNEKEAQLVKALEALPSVSSVISYVGTAGRTVPEAFVPEENKNKLIRGGYTRMLLTLQTDFEDEQAFDSEKEIKTLMSSYYPEGAFLIGETPNTADLKTIVNEDNLWVNAVAFASIAFILMLTFKGLGMPALLLLVIESAIFINLSFPYFQNSSIFFIGYLIISAVQLGATVDYAILYGNRYLENRVHLGKKQAAHQTIRDTGMSILTSAGIMAVSGFFLGGMSSNGVISQLGVLIGRGALISSLLVLTVLPSLVCVFDKWVTRPLQSKVKQWIDVESEVI